MGPSASGKTSLAISIAKEFDAEIVSADSRLIYREMDIATAKPSDKEKQGIVHHLIDIKDPTEEYTVAEYADDAKKAIDKIAKNCKVPVVAGGTGLYFRILLENYDLPRVAPDEELRSMLELKDTKELYDELLKLDPLIAAKIHFNNKVKIIRAIEVSKKLGIPMSQAQGIKDSDYDVLWIGLNSSDRNFLYERINFRVDKMIEEGLLKEAKSLFLKYPNLQLLKSTIGYQEFYPYFSGDCSLEESIEALKQNTRRYAKRQLSWFRSNTSINWLNIDELPAEKLIDSVKSLCSKFLGSENC